ncbi:DUF1573 domain-containing protein [Mucilaginibacter robiniae]|uniref:DUF1573 domain-containing protein n=1 Tax=Mucilaginibacter robiniae TaxID=2728022 RepID=A0A7L5DTK0_9SPHI|nr:DUF1573 domain-containing protein [Mucilaginibacter robiniae]QJD94435.1 DUF1573 domain-containing protein [Mucilaginibacter robiniae]
MRNLIVIALLAGTLAACQSSTTNQQNGGDSASTSASTKVNPALAPVIKFEHEVHDFGKIKQGDKVTYAFDFTNNGKSPLIITDAVATCGCTRPEWPKEPTKPGDKGTIKVTFNSIGKTGQQDKMITVTANTIPAQSMVHLTGEVIDPNKK